MRNWDYRYCWIRDATLTLYALLSAGYRGEARAWREWLLRAAAGHPSEMQIMYGIAGERRLTEWEVPWLPGYEGSAPVRIGNAAHEQLQLDVYGELMDALYACRRYGLDVSPFAWELQKKLLEYVEKIWERAGLRHLGNPRRAAPFHLFQDHVPGSRSIAAIKSVEQYGLEGPSDHWKELRRQIAEQILR